MKFLKYCSFSRYSPLERENRPKFEEESICKPLE